MAPSDIYPNTINTTSKAKISFIALKFAGFNTFLAAKDKNRGFSVKKCKLRLNSAIVHFLSLMMLFLWQNLTIDHFFSYFLKINGKIIYFYL